MICHRCLQRFAPVKLSPSASLFRSSSTRRALSTTVSRQSQQPSISPSTTSSAKPRQPSGAPSATSTAAAQPFSTPLSPSPENLGIEGTPVTTKEPDVPPTPPPPESSVPAGVPLRGLAYIKNRADPVALEDSEYPPWLWGCLSSSKAGRSAAGGDADGSVAAEADKSDLYSNSKKARQAAGRRLRKRAALNPNLLAPKIPVHQQSTDLQWNADMTNAAGGREARETREEVTHSLRVVRRKTIKEANFLKGMK
ncbi:MAG: hypothetical protein M1837_002546 [Sclerophora amabilis]|nr:MAG: hypothetical protein M1837_002546 [Sclerophora amabilis]